MARPWAARVGKARLCSRSNRAHTAAMSPMRDQAILLHGLGRGAGSMEPMARALVAAGYGVRNVNYPSTTAAIEVLADRVINQAMADCHGAARVHFVTHSMGGILVRAYLQHRRPHQLGRVVMLGPPNSGSHLVDYMSELPPFEWLNGPAAAQLGTHEESYVNGLGPAWFEAGVIAGSMALNPIYAAMIDGQNDGKVSVEATRLDGMADHLVLPVTHTWMMMNPLVIAETLEFLQHGRFDHGLRYGAAVRRLLDAVAV